MMKNKYLVLFFAFLLITSCSKNECEPAGEEEGTWFLVNISGGFAGVNENISKGDITWKFNDAKLVIKNNYTGPLNVSLSSDTYDYKIIPTIEGPELHLNGKYNTHMNIRYDSMELYQYQLADGFNFLLVR